MAIMQNSSSLVSRLRHRGRIVAAQASLTMRYRLSGPFWVDYNCIKLPFHGDGDLQELYYHLDGKEWFEGGCRVFSHYLPAGGVAIDIGANLGLVSGILSTVVGPMGQVHSFEPSPVSYRKLRETIDANGYKNIQTYNVGCGTTDRSITLFCPDSSGNATMRPDAAMEQSAKKRYTVSIVNLDAFLGSKLDRVDFFKVDSEGFEDEIIGGAVGILTRFKPVIYIELSSQHLAASQRAASILSGLGYTFSPELDLENSTLGDNFFALPPGVAVAA
jgi:FkbM family methyltransferase